jgi:NhaA family Na+:H+ antiporter
MKPAPSPDRARRLISAFIRHEATAGAVLTLAAILALIVSNSPLSGLYHAALEAPLTVGLGNAVLEKSLGHWINDGLMAIFFLLVGLEIKREALEGHLSRPDQVILPAIAAVGGMAVPALIYALINLERPELLGGWAIPAATDIAFALGALALAGRRVPLSLKVFLLTLATLDDLGAILIIAIFYTSGLSWLALALAGLALAALFTLNRAGVAKVTPYMLIGLVLWLCVLKSGVHATLAGVMLGLAIPLESAGGQRIIPRLENILHPYVKFLILPLFAFANAGLSLDGMQLSTLAESLPLGIAAGLALGKPIGIFLTVWLAVKFGLAHLPEGARWRQVLGVACLAGIGFTMSLFIGLLAFRDPTLIMDVRLGVLTGSLVSVALGLLVLLARAR